MSIDVCLEWEGGGPLWLDLAELGPPFFGFCELFVGGAIIVFESWWLLWMPPTTKMKSCSSLRPIAFCFQSIQCQDQLTNPSINSRRESNRESKEWWERWLVQVSSIQHSSMDVNDDALKVQMWAFFYSIEKFNGQNITHHKHDSLVVHFVKWIGFKLWI